MIRKILGILCCAIIVSFFPAWVLARLICLPVYVTMEWGLGKHTWRYYWVDSARYWDIEIYSRRWFDHWWETREEMFERHFK